MLRDAYYGVIGLIIGAVLFIGIAVPLIKWGFSSPPPTQIIKCDSRAEQGLVLAASSYYPDGTVVCSYVKTWAAAPQRFPGQLKEVKK